MFKDRFPSTGPPVPALDHGKRLGTAGVSGLPGVMAFFQDTRPHRGGNVENALVHQETVSILGEVAVHNIALSDV